MATIEQMIEWGDYERALATSDPSQREQVLAHVARCLHEDYMSQLGYQVRGVLGVFDMVRWYSARLVADGPAPGKLHLIDAAGKLMCSASIKAHAAPRGIWAAASMFDYTACLRCEVAAAQALDVEALAEMAEERHWPVPEAFTQRAQELLARRLATSDWKAAWESACIESIAEHVDAMPWKVQPSMQWCQAAALVAFKALVHHQYWWHHVSFYISKSLIHQAGKPPMRHLKLGAVDYLREQCVRSHEAEIEGKAGLGSAPTRYLAGTLIPLLQRAQSL